MASKSWINGDYIEQWLFATNFWFGAKRVTERLDVP
jgi:hypothetical protein